MNRTGLGLVCVAMKIIVIAILASCVLACSGGVTAPQGDAGDIGEDAVVAGDGAVALEDAGEAPDAPGEVMDAFAVASEDAALETLDGGAPLTATVSLAEACARSDAAFRMTPCNPEFARCAFTAGAVPEARVAACEMAITAAGAESAGGTPEMRCANAMTAQRECRE